MFPETRWTLVLRAGRAGAREPRALEELLSLYWRPVWVYLRARGASAEDAEELTQELFAELFAGGASPDVSGERGRFRSWIKACATHHHLRWLESGRALKRGGGARFVAMDTALLERVAADATDPEAALDQAWAATVMERALSRLRAEYDAGDRVGGFALLERFFGAGEAPSYRVAAAESGMSLPQLKAFVHRGRVRFRELVAEEVRDTVGSAAAGEAEVSALFQALQ
ncbi:RNA polymerase subunit sigma-24 [Deltaproteobacteria bacterium]|nr:RNA polymerase subunit sigma-24 [Deltaproteobacteria bacterium]